MSAILASPLLLTSKPAPPPVEAPVVGSRSCALYRASFLKGNVRKSPNLSRSQMHTLLVNRDDILVPDQIGIFSPNVPR